MKNSFHEQKIKKDILINEFNKTLKKNLIILPTIDNINEYKSSTIISDKVLFLDELSTEINILSSKQKPIHIRFKTRNITNFVT